jgi:FkbM family methyltransferase
MRTFLSQFVGAGHLVFDIGANRGEFAELFSGLGATVVAVEPNPELVGIIRSRVPAAIVERAAVGAQQGTADLWVGGSDGDSTLSPEYLDVLARATDVKRRPISVPVTTLDALIARHGMPDFVKIDVEGYEWSVFRGLSARPAALSFEFHASLLHELDKCLERLAGYRFRIAVGNDFTWATEWSQAAEISRRAAELSSGRESLFGDVYACDERRP